MTDACAIRLMKSRLGTFMRGAMSSYALLQAFSGARYDAVEKILYLSRRSKETSIAFCLPRLVTEP